MHGSHPNLRGMGCEPHAAATTRPTTPVYNSGRASTGVLRVSWHYPAVVCAFFVRLPGQRICRQPGYFQICASRGAGVSAVREACRCMARNPSRQIAYAVNTPKPREARMAHRSITRLRVFCMATQLLIGNSPGERLGEGESRFDNQQVDCRRECAEIGECRCWQIEYL